MFGMEKRAEKKRMDAIEEQKNSVDLDNYFEQVILDEMRDLHGQWVTVKFKEGDIRGKIRYLSRESCSFVARSGERGVDEYLGLFAKGIDCPYDLSSGEGPARIYKTGEDRTFFFEGKVEIWGHQIGGSNWLNNGDKLQGFLGQEYIDFSEAAA